MEKWPLKWITEEKLTQICQEICTQGKPKTEGLDYRNIVDPFSALFDMAMSHVDYDEWIKNEITRQHQKTLQNAVGTFHQKVLGSIAGWEEVDDRIDLKCDKRKIIAEVKNKFNTVTGKHRINVLKELAGWRSEKGRKKYTGYFVQILAKETLFKQFTTTDNNEGGMKSTVNGVYEIDGKSFYALVTGSDTALDDLYNVLPFILEKIKPDNIDAEKTVADHHFKDFFQQLPPPARESINSKT
jgi:hypothetical protein